MKNFPKARVSDLVTSEIGEEVLVYDLKTNKCHCLNKTAYFIWQHCDGQTDVVEIANRMKDVLTVSACDLKKHKNKSASTPKFSFFRVLSRVIFILTLQ